MVLCAIGVVMLTAQKAEFERKTTDQKLISQWTRSGYDKCQAGTLEPGHSHHVVVVRCRNFSGSMAIDLDGSRCLNRDMCKHVVAVVPICGGRFVRMGLDPIHHIDYQRGYGIDSP